MMSVSDLAFSSPSSAEWKESDLDESGVAEPEWKSMRAESSHSPNSIRRTSLDMTKLEVKAPTARRSGLLASQLRRYADQ